MRCFFGLELFKRKFNDAVRRRLFKTSGRSNQTTILFEKIVLPIYAIETDGCATSHNYKFVADLLELNEDSDHGYFLINFLINHDHYPHL